MELIGATLVNKENRMFVAQYVNDVTLTLWTHNVDSTGIPTVFI